MVEENVIEFDSWAEANFGEEEDLRKISKVILKNIPITFDENGLRNMCQLYGEIEDLHQPSGAQFAFVQYKSAPEAENLLRRFEHDHPNLPITVEFAREREKEYRRPPSTDEYEFLDKMSLISDENPLRNVLELNKRKIQGPFGDPFEIKIDSLMQGKNYRKINILLRSADPNKEFLWDSNDEAYAEFESNNQRKIVHGRSILKSRSIEPYNTDESSKLTTKLKLFSFNSSGNNMPVIQNCVNCFHAADKNCQNCEETFCSFECHSVKLNKSIKTAGEMPSSKVVFIPDPILAEPIGQSVIITCIINHRLLFVRPAENKQNVAFSQLMCETVKCAKYAKILTNLPSIGSLVLAKFDYYQRALVLKHIPKSSNVVVAFIDFGNIEIRDFNELKIMPDHLKKRKRFATKIHLDNINYDLMNDKALKYLYDLMMHNTELQIKTVLKDDNVMCQLKASDKWVNEMVNAMNTDNIIVPNIKNMSYRVFHDLFVEKFEKPIDCKKMAGKEVIITDNSQIELHYLAFILAEDWIKFVQNDRKTQNICNYLFAEPMCYTPKNDEVCVVKLNNRWYRAYCVEVCFDGYVTMQFIDYGNMKLIEINNVRMIPDELLFECLTMMPECFTNDFTSDKASIEKMIEYKSKYEKLSHHKIQRMERCKTKNYMGEILESIYAWL